MRPGSTRPHQARAEAVGFANDLYDVDFDTKFTQHGRRFVDALWDEYEPRLPAALDMLAGGRCDLDHWINVLVPFVGSLLIRDRWYQTRIADAHRHDNPEPWIDGLDDFAFSDHNINVNRIIGRNGAMGRLLVSDWFVGETTHDLCTSDLGYAYLPEQVEHKGRMRVRASVLVPTSRRTLLVVRPEPRVQVLTRRNGLWGRGVYRFEPGSCDAATANAAIAQSAQDFIAGSDQAIGSVGFSLIAKYSPSSLQSAQECWPCRTRTSDLAGIWSPLRQATLGVPPSVIATTPLQPLAGITDRFHEKVTTVNATRPGQAHVLQDVLSLDSSGFHFEW